MKRTAGAFMLLASLGGGCVSSNKNVTPGPSFNQVSYAKEIPGVVGPMGQPIAQGVNGQAFVTASDNMGVTSAGYQARGSSQEVSQAGFLKGGFGQSNGGCSTCGTGDGHMKSWQPFSGGHFGMKHQGGGVPTYGKFTPGQGILPVPSMGPPGAVAAIGALPANMPMMPVNARTSIKFNDPAGMNVTWYGPNGLNEVPLITPARYNFGQGGIYRLKLTNINKHPGLDLYPTLEVYPAAQNTVTFLAHSSVPVSFTEADIEQVVAGNFLTKVIYLPNPQYQDLSLLAGPSEITSTQLEPGMDPVVEAMKRGTILLVIRMGNIDLQVPNSPAMDAPNPFAAPPSTMPSPTMPGVPGLSPVPSPMPKPVEPMKEPMKIPMPESKEPKTPAKTTSRPMSLPPIDQNLVIPQK